MANRILISSLVNIEEWRLYNAIINSDARYSYLDAYLRELVSHCGIVFCIFSLLLCELW